MSKITKLSINFAMGVLFIFTTAHADESVDTAIELPASDQELLDELMNIVDESTAIATKTKMNTNYVPGTVTVLEGKELETLGVRTAWDAMKLVPGFLPTRDPNGGTSIVSRGLSFPFSSGNVKVLINSLAMSQQNSGFNSSILQIPIEQIKRIEVVRGPGAILYGDNAFMGLINIITHSDEQKLFTRIEGNGAVSGGITGSYTNEPNQLQVYGNLYGYGNDSADAANNRFAEEDRQFGVFSLSYHGFTLSVQSFHRDFEQPDRPLAREGSDIFSARQQIELTPTLSTELNFSYLKNDFNRPGANYDGDKIESSIDVNWTGMDNHNWWFKFSYTDETIDNAFQRLAQPQQPLNISNETRKYFSLSLQDQFELTEDLTITSGLRFDHRDDLGKDFFTPRISAVWRITDAHILKAQYAEGFRVPTSFELFSSTGGRSDLKTETIATSELNYIYHQPTHTGRITLFYSHLEDMIFSQGPRFVNAAEAENRGIEVEWEQQILSNLKWQANLSFVDSWSTRGGNGIQREDPSSTNWLSNITFFYQPMDKVLLTAHWNYTGQRDKPTVDISAENNLNFTVNVSDVLTKGLGFKVGIQNILKDNEQDNRSGPNNSTRLDFGDKQMIWAQFSYTL